MSAETAERFTIDFEETELRLGLGRPAGVSSNGEGATRSGGKRVFLETVDLKLNLSSKEDGGSVEKIRASAPAEKKMNSSDGKEKSVAAAAAAAAAPPPPSSSSEVAKPPAKAQVVGWPPVRSFRKNIMAVQKSGSDEAEKGGSSGNGAATSGAAFVKVSPTVRPPNSVLVSLSASPFQRRAKLFSDLPLPIHHHHHHHHHHHRERERERERMGVSAKIAPSMLSSDFANLASEARRMLDCGADWLHMDIMDGHFVPNLTMGAPVIKSLRKHTNAYLDCHLMVTNPLDYVEPLGDAGASGFTFHVEVSRENWPELVKKIKSKGMRPGVSLRPGTPIEEVYPLVEGENPVEMVLVMTVEPGFGGQKFMPEMMEKVRVLRAKYPSLDIEVDGGLGPSTIDMAASAGANCIVAGSSVFGSPEPAQVILHMRKSVEDVQNSN